MYLAEDRIFCLEVFAKLGAEYILSYLPGAWAITDPPTNLIAIIA